MDVSTTLAHKAYGAARPALAPTPKDAMADAAQSFASVLQQGEAAAMASMRGESDPHALVEALTQTELAVQTAVSVRDKVVEAYQEILRMPV
ncbi:flagellar hook-basal body complex protein FliE [Litoreibacter ponti]|uniref:Flagellar hook-basal body complex protein FliE n=1 Tax=Litoreibacter ponti TaxID=1510457 RepID=A0A2T6BNF6_9RHOB|nr:flagellar hook-basal body complex protein FliE [Litoreibacter ponti]PTX57576.1 flagellar hook-basal body complex protein FliE [Litoreibacter ponti]